jgi:two-component system, sensor histidine kinase
MSESILIVDNEIEVSRKLERILAQRGIHCYRSSSAKDAIELMKRIRFHMAFLDTSLPEMKGMELTRKLKSLDPKMNIVIVSDTSLMEDEKRDFALDECPFSACIYKPVLNKAVLDALDTCW